MILVAISGDTGKAALEGYKNVEGTKIKVFYPTGGVSRIQKLQMQTQEGDNVSVSGIVGNFDDAQNGVKRIFSDPKMAEALNERGIFLSSANSINWGRLVPQIVYYISAYCEASFGAHAAPVTKIDDSTYMLELWHGPTCAFKDMALQIMPKLFVRALRKCGEERTAMILVAISGDTGKAALEGYKNVEGTKIKVFYPTGGVSRIQKLQMQTQEGDNVSVSGIVGNFDDAQNGVKRIFSDPKMAEALNERGIFLSSANSINWGRLVPQIVYYISAYCDMVKSGAVSLGDRIDVCVPTGNFGNIFAGYIA